MANADPIRVWRMTIETAHSEPAPAPRAASNQYTPTVSAVVATRDRPVLLRRAIRSLLSQTGASLTEIIVVFDQAEPDTQLPDDFPGSHIRIVKNTNRPGLCGARNTGIDLAVAEWVAFCDDDDEWTGDKLTQQFKVIGPGTDFVVGGIRIVHETRSINRTPGGESIEFERLLRSRVMEAHPSTFLIRRAALAGSIGRVDEDIPGGYYEDYDLLLRAAKLSPIAVADTPVAVIYWHRQSMFKNRWRMIIDAIDYLIEKTPELRQTRSGLARLTGQQAFALSGLADRRGATRKAIETFALDPRQLRTYLTLAVVITRIPAERLVWLANSFGRGI